MWDILTRENLVFSTVEKEHLKALYNKVRSSRSEFSAEGDRFEIEFYALMQRFPRLRSVYFAVFDVENVDACTNKLESLRAIASQRPLTADEFTEKQQHEAALAVAQRHLSGLLESLRPGDRQDDDMAT